MHAKIVSTRTASDRSGVKAIVYGRAKLGKTTLCASCPSPLIVSAERGLLSLRGYNLPAWEVNSIDDLTEVFTYVLQSSEARQFHTICLDSISDLAEVLLAHEKKVNPNKSNGFKPYAELADKFMSTLRAFRALQGKHVYFIAKEEHDKDDSGMMMFQPSMPGSQLTRQIPYLVDEIFRLVLHTDPVSQETSRWLQCQPTSTAIAGDRSGMLAPYEPANLGAVFQKIMA